MKGYLIFLILACLIKLKYFLKVNRIRKPKLTSFILASASSFITIFRLRLQAQSVRFAKTNYMSKIVEIIVFFRTIYTYKT